MNPLKSSLALSVVHRQAKIDVIPIVCPVVVIGLIKSSPPSVLGIHREAMLSTRAVTLPLHVTIGVDMRKE